MNEPVKIRIGKSNKCYWKTVTQFEIVDIPYAQGIKLGFTPFKHSLKTTEGIIGNKVVETKQIETDKGTDRTDEFLKELCSINGIGKKTAEDIIRIFPEREELIKTIRSPTKNNALPLREDACTALKKRYLK